MEKGTGRPAISNAKYESTGETKVWLGVTLHRIRAKIAIGPVAAGAVVGWVESEKNLGVSGNAWVFGNAQVYGDAVVSGNAQVYGDAVVSGNARVYGNAQVSGHAQVSGNAQVYGDAVVYGVARVSGDAVVYGNARVYYDALVSGHARVYGDARVSGRAQVYGDARVSGRALVSGPARVSGVVLLATRSDNYNFVAVQTPYGPRIIAGCRYFTFAEARKHWNETRGGTQLGDESLALVDFLERMCVIRGFMEPVK
ncbi:MAG: polymer-forming cytoskeletal protein [Novosphingobium sp.]